MTGQRVAPEPGFALEQTRRLARQTLTLCHKSRVHLAKLTRSIEDVSFYLDRAQRMAGAEKLRNAETQLCTSQSAKGSGP